MFRQCLSFLVIAAIVSWCCVAQADTLYGTCVYKDGSKAGSEIGISTSWNGKKAYPANGRYTLDFGGTVNHSITVYVKGKAVGRVYVSGNTRLDIVVP
jgi:hypothetical protein